MQVSVLFLGAAAICALAGDVVTPQDASYQDLNASLSTPSGDHWLGTDSLGRDVLSRLVAGARTALVGPALLALGSLLLGGSLGLLAGFRGGLVDALILRWIDLMYSVPALLIVIVLVGTLGGGYAVAVGLLILLTAPSDARVVRAAALEQRPRAYVDAAIALGVSQTRILYRHIWPNVRPVALANTFLNFAYGLIALSGLSFLGLGVQPGTPDWGRMLAENRALVFINPASALAPAAMIILTAVAMNLVGDWVGERLGGRERAR